MSGEKPKDDGPVKMTPRKGAATEEVVAGTPTQGAIEDPEGLLNDVPGAKPEQTVEAGADAPAAPDVEETLIKHAEAAAGKVEAAVAGDPKDTTGDDDDELEDVDLFGDIDTGTDSDPGPGPGPEPEVTEEVLEEETLRPAEAGTAESSTAEPGTAEPGPFTTVMSGTLDKPAPETAGLPAPETTGLPVSETADLSAPAPIRVSLEGDQSTAAAIIYQIEYRCAEYIKEGLYTIGEVSPESVAKFIMDINPWIGDAQNEQANLKSLIPDLKETLGSLQDARKEIIGSSSADSSLQAARAELDQLTAWLANHNKRPEDGTKQLLAGLAAQKAAKKNELETQIAAKSADDETAKTTLQQIDAKIEEIQNNFDLTNKRIYALDVAIHRAKGVKDTLLEHLARQSDSYKAVVARELETVRNNDFFGNEIEQLIRENGKLTAANSTLAMTNNALQGGQDTLRRDIVEVQKEAGMQGNEVDLNVLQSRIRSARGRQSVALIALAISLMLNGVLGYKAIKTSQDNAPDPTPAAAPINPDEKADPTPVPERVDDANPKSGFDPTK